MESLTEPVENKLKLANIIGKMIYSKPGEVDLLLFTSLYRNS